MKVLIVGNGGREHALAWKVAKSARITRVFVAPGNAGTAREPKVQNVAIDVLDFPALADLARREDIGLTIVGPEMPLVAGIRDYFDARGLPCFGPSRAAAQLEGSKAFTKSFLERHRIPTAAYRAFTELAAAEAYVRERGVPIVVKADGLAAGKGVVVASDRAEAQKAVEDLMIHHVAGREAAQRVVIEEALTGREASLLVFADGRDYALMPAARDHKRIGENDTGPNTGGMGTITDISVLDKDIQDRVVREIVEPTLAGAREEGFPFKGVLFLGLMLTDDGPKLLEYNVRFGDPETQAILVRLKTDLFSIFEAMHTGTLGGLDVEWSEGASACVVAANKGYPGKYESGAVIEGLDEFREGPVQVFHAGTSRDAGGRVTATGGRVLGITVGAERLSDALSLCYGAVEKIHWPGMQFRRDIGKS